MGGRTPGREGGGRKVDREKANHKVYKNLKGVTYVHSCASLLLSGHGDVVEFLLSVGANTEVYGISLYVCDLMY